MANVYCLHTGDGSDGTTWAKAYTTLAAAVTAAGAGGTVYISQAHAESSTGASISLVSPGTVNNITKVICINDSTGVLTTGASVTMSTGAYSINLSGYCHMHGVSLVCNSGGNTAGIIFGNTNFAWFWRLTNCHIYYKGTSNSVSAGFSTGIANFMSLLIFENSTYQCDNAAGGFIRAGRNFIWKNKSDSVAVIPGASSVLPTILLKNQAPGMGNILLEGLDLSNLGSGKSLVDGAVYYGSSLIIKNCKIGALTSPLSAAIANPHGTICIDNCDSGDTNYRMARYMYSGSIVSETTKVRTGGASDGTTPLSWLMTSLATCYYAYPLVSPAITLWNETVGSAITLTVEIAQDSAATALTESEVWLEVEYLGTSGSTTSTFLTDNNSDILTPSTTDQASSSVTWASLTTPTKQQLSVTVTPEEKGVVFCKVYLAKPSTALYIDPLVTVS